MNEFISTYGIAFIFVNVLADQIGLPVPAIPGLVIAGALAANGELSALGLFTAAIAATLIGDSAWYYAGRHYGNRVMKTLCRISLTPDACVNQSQTFFDRWGMNALIIGKFVPGLATVLPALAGATRIGLPRFLLFSTASASLWVGTGLVIGMALKGQVEPVLAQMENMGSIAITVVGTLFAAYIVWKWWERYRFLKRLRMARVSVDELYRLMDSGAEPLIVDVRTQSARMLEPRRIRGALHVPLHAVEQHVKELPRDRDIILYCTCPNEVSAAEAAKVLLNSGFTRVRPLHGGLEAWIAAGYAVEEIEVAPV
jgi:membrane protein DedA with SNARE-associated domain/rhodanese-related sulfurtransferase